MVKRQSGGWSYLRDFDLKHSARGFVARHEIQDEKKKKEKGERKYSVNGITW